MPGDIEISVVIPTLNEEGNVADMAKAVRAALASAGVARYELIFIDNGSSDRTVAIVRELCATDPSVRLIVNARNFGQMRSPTYGIYQARGRAVIGMCADFQDPPGLLPELVARWRRGTKIVLGVRETEPSSWTLSLGRKIGYGFLQRFGDYPVIPGATGFGLYDRAVVDTLAAWNEPEPFFRGMLVETGFSLETIPYRRPPRATGRSKNNAATLLSFALSGLASSSKKLLRVPLVLGAALLPLAVALGLGGAVAGVLGRRALPLVASSLAILGFALTFVFLGLLGEQVRLISERTRNAQLVIERERVNFEEGACARRR